jgi:hypothetical protein
MNFWSEEFEERAEVLLVESRRQSGSNTYTYYAN